MVPSTDYMRRPGFIYCSNSTHSPAEGVPWEVCKSVCRSSTSGSDKMILLSPLSKPVLDSGRHSLQKNNNVLLWYHNKLLHITKQVALFVEVSEHRWFQQTANAIWSKVHAMQRYS